MNQLRLHRYVYHRWDRGGDERIFFGRGGGGFLKLLKGKGGMVKIFEGRKGGGQCF